MHIWALPAVHNFPVYFVSMFIAQRKQVQAVIAQHTKYK